MVQVLIETWEKRPASVRRFAAVSGRADGSGTAHEVVSLTLAGPTTSVALGLKPANGSL